MVRTIAQVVVGGIVVGFVVAATVFILIESLRQWGYKIAIIKPEKRV